MWDQVIGHEENKQFLHRLLTSRQHPHALLFYGPDGVGKCFLAKHFTRSLLCLNPHDGEPCGACESCRLLNFASGNIAHPDYIFIAPAEDSKLHMIKTEQMHTLLEQAAFGPTMGKYKVCIIDEADTMNAEAANAFLKFLEEPAPGWVFILVASGKDKLLPTILSRVIQVRFNPLVAEETEKILLTRGLDSAQAEILAKLAGGSLGVALTYQQEDVLQIREEVLEYLSSFPMTAPLAFLTEKDYWKDLFGKESSNLRLEIFCQLVQSILRDVIFMKENLSAQLLNCDLEDKLQEFGRKWSHGSLPEAVMVAGEAVAAVHARNNAKNVLEILTFKLNECLEGRA